MTNERLLRDAINSKGYKLKFVADYIGITYQAFLNKISNKSDFRASEIQSLCELLDISGEMRDLIFFAIG